MPSLNEKIDKLNTQIKADPDNAELYVQRGAEMWEVQGFDQAIADLEKAVSLSPDTPEYYHQLADYYMDYFRSQQAVKTMETAGLKFLERIPTLLKLAEFYLIVKEYGAADRTLDRIEKIEPLNSEMFYMRAQVQKDQGNIEEAVSYLRFATENNPDFTDAYLKLGELTAESDPKLALQFYDNAVRTAPDNPDALMMKAYHLSNIMDKPAAAVDIYREVHKLDPQNEQAFYNSGLLYMDLDSLQRAYEQFTLAIKVSPTAAESYYYRGVTSEMRGDVSAAKSDYEQVTRLSPNFRAGREALERVSTQVAQ